MTLRLATEEDYPNLLRMAKAFHHVSPYRDLEFSESQCRDLFDAFLENPSKVIIVMFDHGMIIGMVSTPPFSTDTVSSELAWWVDPDYRGRESVELMEAYIDWSRRVGAKITQMAMLNEVTDLDKFYRRQGFSPAEKSYVRFN